MKFKKNNNNIIIYPKYERIQLFNKNQKISRFPFIMDKSYKIPMMPFNNNNPQRHIKYINGNVIYNKNRKKNKKNKNNQNNY